MKKSVILLVALSLAISTSVYSQRTIDSDKSYIQDTRFNIESSSDIKNGTIQVENTLNSIFAFHDCGNVFELDSRLFFLPVKPLEKERLWIEDGWLPYGLKHHRCNINRIVKADLSHQIFHRMKYRYNLIKMPPKEVGPNGFQKRVLHLKESHLPLPLFLQKKYLDLVV